MWPYRMRIYLAFEEIIRFCLEMNNDHFYNLTCAPEFKIVKIWGEKQILKYT